MNLVKTTGSVNTHYVTHSTNRDLVSVENTNALAIEKLLPRGSDNMIGRLNDYYQNHIAGLSIASQRAIKYDLQLFLKFFFNTNGNKVSLETWTVRDSKLFQESLLNQYAPASVNRTMSSVRAFGKYLRDEGVFKNDPCSKIRVLKLPEPKSRGISSSDYHRLLKAVEILIQNPKSKHSQFYRDYVILTVLNSSGLRISELLHLKINQFDHQKRKLMQVRRKGGRYTDTLIKKESSELLRVYIETFRKSSTDFIFVNYRGEGPLSRNAISKAFRKIAQQASAWGGEVKLRPHMVRHKHGRDCYIARGVSFAAKRLSHSSLTHTQRYIVEDEESEREAIEEI